MLRRFLILFLVGALLLLTACHKTMSADALMRNLLAAYPFPQGQIYSSEEKVNSGRHLTDEMLSVLYGEGERPLYHSLAVHFLPISIMLLNVAFLLSAMVLGNWTILYSPRRCFPIG